MKTEREEMEIGDREKVSIREKGNQWQTFLQERPWWK